MYIVLDLETTTRCPVGKNPANPMWPDNDIVATGYIRSDHPHSYYYKYKEDNKPPTALVDLLDTQADDIMLVGQNIKFDALYLLRHLRKPYLPKLWDVQLAEYILTGQQHTYASLDELSEKYGGTKKDDRMKAMWDAGVPTEDIPRGMLLEYLEDDVSNTELVFKAQYELALKNGILPLMSTQMDALRATTMMNWWGMRVDTGLINDSILTLKLEEDAYEDAINAMLASVAYEGMFPKEAHYTSPKDLSMIFFGGTHKSVEKRVVGTYKNGKDKYANTEVFHVYTGIVDKSKVDMCKVPMTKLGYYSTDDSVLTVLEKAGYDIATTIKNARAVRKQRTTYYEALQSLVFPRNMVYPNLNHTATKTGRLSCTNPNLQNQTTDGGVKQVYTSRYGKLGCIIELDYSQLEMVALAVLSNDEQLLEDIKNGVDMHSELYRSMYGTYPTKAQRKSFKSLTFGLVYGAGAKTLAENSGYPVADASRFIKTFYTRYPGVAVYHTDLINRAKRERVVTSKFDKETGLPIGEFVLRSETGRHYVFREYPNTYGGTKDMSFSPTELKNWQVQGFATGDVVPMMVGILQRKLESTFSNAHLIMTVHDSVLIDCQLSTKEWVIDVAKEILESASEYIKGTFGMFFPLMLQVGVSCGPNWLDQEELSFA